MEAVFTMIFGPLLTCVFVCLDLKVSDTAPSHRISNLFLNLSRSMHRCTIFLALSVVIASVIRTQQVAPISELSFMKYLGLYQFMVSLGAAVSYITVSGWQGRESIAMIAYNVIIFIFLTATWSMAGFPSSEAQVLEQLTIYCHDYQDWPLPVENFAEDQSKSQFGAIFWSSYIGGVLVAALVWIYFEEWRLRVKDKLVNGFSSLCEWFHVKPHRVVIVSGVITGAVYWGWTCSSAIIFLLNQREELQNVLGPAYADAEWGFGQVTAMLLWGPLIHDIVMETIGECRYPLMDSAW